MCPQRCSTWPQINLAPSLSHAFAQQCNRAGASVRRIEEYECVPLIKRKTQKPRIKPHFTSARPGVRYPNHLTLSFSFLTGKQRQYCLRDWTPVSSISQQTLSARPSAGCLEYTNERDWPKTLWPLWSLHSATGRSVKWGSLTIVLWDKIIYETHLT